MINRLYISHCEERGVVLKTDVQLHELTSFHIGGSALYFYSAKNEHDVVTCVNAAQLFRIKVCMIGGGSNILVADKGFDGLVLRLDCTDVLIHEDVMNVGAGCVTAQIASQSASAGLTGFEWAAGIPGRIGGAIYGNAGAMNGEMKDVVKSTRSMNMQTGKITLLQNAECAFEYRHSIFKNNGEIILSCELQLSSGIVAESQKKIREALSYRNTTQPKKYGSSGCMFKNYVLDEHDIPRLRSLSIPESMLLSRRISAGWLIDQSGGKGMQKGGAVVSSVHGNFIVNRENATASDVYMLAQTVKRLVKSKFDILLEEEVCYIGF